MNIYITSEPAEKLETLIINFKNFYVFDVQKFIADMGIDTRKKANIYYINNEIISDLTNVSKLKKYQGIIYINKNISESLYKNLKKKFSDVPSIGKFILIDNGNASRHRELFDVFEEVYFYQRFRKNKIVDYSVQIPDLDEQRLSGEFQADEEI